MQQAAADVGAQVVQVRVHGVGAPPEVHRVREVEARLVQELPRDAQLVLQVAPHRELRIALDNTLTVHSSPCTLSPKSEHAAGRTAAKGHEQLLKRETAHSPLHQANHCTKPHAGRTQVVNMGMHLDGFQKYTAMWRKPCCSMRTRSLRSFETRLCSHCSSRRSSGDAGANCGGKADRSELHRLTKDSAEPGLTAASWEHPREQMDRPHASRSLITTQGDFKVQERREFLDARVLAAAGAGRRALEQRGCSARTYASSWWGARTVAKRRDATGSSKGGSSSTRTGRSAMPLPAAQAASTTSSTGALMRHGSAPSTFSAR